MIMFGATTLQILLLFHIQISRNDAFTIPLKFKPPSLTTSSPVTVAVAVTNHLYPPTNTNISTRQSNTLLFESASSSSGGYIPPEQSPATRKNKAPQPKVGDVVRYYDLDGGKIDGQELIGKITFIQEQKKAPPNEKWLAEITEMEDVGDGYYTEYPSRKRRKSKYYNIQQISPLIASFVRSEDAWKVPTDINGRPSPSYNSYDLEDYQGPMSMPVNQDVVQTDLNNYGQLKNKLLKDTAIAGLVGTIVAELTRGLDDALIYFAGAVAGLGYVFFLSIKTDTLGSQDAKLGSKVSNLRFVLPLLVIIGVAIQNLIAGDASPVAANSGSGNDLLRTVSPEQFAAAMIGFLTYRIPLFASQLGPLISDSAGLVLPGSAGMAMQMMNDKDKSSSSKKKSLLGEDLVTVLLVSGPQGAGKAELVEKLMEDSQGKLVSPKRVDIVAEPMQYERLVAKDEVLQVDGSGRYALTKDGILSAARKPETGEEIDQVVVVDADVKLCKKLVNVGGIRLVGVWVGLDQVSKFEANLEKELESGAIQIPEDETKESVLRSKIREIVKDIEYGVVSGIFEFTVLNDDFDKSLLQLKNAANYCFDE
jgi:hypothetical protein